MVRNASVIEILAAFENIMKKNILNIEKNILKNILNKRIS